MCDKIVWAVLHVSYNAQMLIANKSITDCIIVGFVLR